MTKQIAIVTGASKGLGKSIAFHLAKKGFHVFALARNAEKLKLLVTEIEKNGNQCSYFAVDVSDKSAVEKCIKEIILKHNHIDLLINNASILKRGTTNLSDQDIDELLNINLHGSIYVAKRVAVQMKTQRSGYIININSLAGKTAMSFAGGYAASKFGLSGFSEALSKELSVYDVKVTNLCPSMIATDMAEGRKFKLEEMIQVEDINHSIDYLLGLSKNAIPTELLIRCLPYIKKKTEQV